MSCCLFCLVRLFCEFWYDVFGVCVLFFFLCLVLACFVRFVSYCLGVFVLFGLLCLCCLSYVIDIVSVVVCVLIVLFM